MRDVCKIRSPRYWSHEEHFTWDLTILAYSFAPPLKIPTKPSLLRHSVLTGQPFAMELPLASPTRCKLHAMISFFECQGHYPHWHSLSVMQSLWATMYGRQKRAKVGQRVHVQTSRSPWWTAFWLAFMILICFPSWSHIWVETHF